MKNQQPSIAKYGYVKYLLQPTQSVNKPTSRTKTATNDFNTISYYDGPSYTLDFRFAEPNDHINIDLNQDIAQNLYHIYLNSANLNNITFTSKEPAKNAILHINMNNCKIDITNTLQVNNQQFINGLAAFLPSIITHDKQQLFKSVSFENMSYTLCGSIKKECEKSGIKNYAMLTDETKQKGYYIYKTTQQKLQHFNLNPVGLKTNSEISLGK